MTIIGKLHTLARLINANANKKSQNIHNLTANLTIYEHSLRITHIGSCIQSSLTITQEDIANEARNSKTGNQALTLVNKANAVNKEQDAILLNAINLADTILKLGKVSDDDESDNPEFSYATINIGQYAGHVTIEQGNRKAKLNEYNATMSTAKGSNVSSGTLKHIPLNVFKITGSDIVNLKRAINYRIKLATSTSEEGEWIYIRNAMVGLQFIGFDGRSVMIGDITATGSDKMFNAFRVELKTFSDMINSFDDKCAIIFSVGKDSLQISDQTLTLIAPISDADGRANAKMDMIEKLWDGNNDVTEQINNTVKVADIQELANAAIFASAMCDNRGDGIFIQIEKDNGEYIDIEGISTDGGNNKVRLNVRVMNPQPIKKCIAPIAITNLKIWKDASASINIGKGEKDKVCVRIMNTRLILMPMTSG